MMSTKIGEKECTEPRKLKNRQQVEEAYTSFSFQPDQKRIRTGKMDNMGKVFYRWFKQAGAGRPRGDGPEPAQTGGEN